LVEPNRPEDLLKVHADEEGSGGNETTPPTHCGIWWR
jgi:hypothetical protein